jgi:hypothetical protein
MALLRRELHRQIKGPAVTHADRCTLVFDTDAKNLYVEREGHIWTRALVARLRSKSDNGYCRLSQARRADCRPPRTMAVAEDAI